MPRARPATPPVSPAIAARVRQLAAQAEHRRAIAEFRTQRRADQQARINALLLEAIAALASLLGAPSNRPVTANTPSGTDRPRWPAPGRDGQRLPARASASSACAARTLTRSAADGKSPIRSIASLAHTGSGGSSPRATPS